MLVRNDILDPIPGDNPAGKDLRYSATYEKIREARREDDQLDQGQWKRERKLADHSLAIRLAQDAIATESKDLQLLVWLTDSMLAKHRFTGLSESLLICRDVIDQFWENFYPLLDEGDPEPRLLLLDWMASKLVIPARTAPLCKDGYGLLAYTESRAIPTEEQAKSKDQKAAREAAIKEGKVPPEAFDKSLAETPRQFYVQCEKDLELCLRGLQSLDELCQQKFGDQAPSFHKLKDALEEVKHTTHGFLEKKRKTEPDPLEEPVVIPEPQNAEPSELPRAAAAVSSGGAAAAPAMAPVPDLTLYVPALTEEPGDRHDAIAAVAAAAAFLRARDRQSVAPYLMLRGLRWGELRSSSDPAILEAPPTELRQQIKMLSLQGKWKELLEAAETVMAMSCGRAWLDLQRFVVQACAALGPEYDGVAVAIRSELRALLRDLPELIDATLTDDTPAANAQTQTWLREIVVEPAAPAPSPHAPGLPGVDSRENARWETKFIDAQVLANEAVRQGQHQKALEILNREIERQRSGRGRFFRKLQLAQICITAGKDTIAQPLLDDLAAAVETHKLEDWEDREMIASALAFLLQASKKIQGDAKVKQAMFERICRLDPVQALSV